MSGLIVEQIVTVDGYAAEPDGGLGFFEEDSVGASDQLVFLEHVDAILFGANTYRMFADYWPNADPEVEAVSEPINRLPKFVVSNSLDEAPWGAGRIEVLPGDGVASAAALKERFGAIVVWGSLTLADALLEAGLVDELRLRVVPVLIGAGRSFTPGGLGTRRLQLDDVVSHPSGHIVTTYGLR